MNEHLVKFNAEVCAMIVTTAAQKAGLPAEAIQQQIQQLSANLYAMGFMLCGNPAAPTVQAVTRQFGIPLQQLVARHVPAPVQAQAPAQPAPAPAAPAAPQPPLLDPLPNTPGWPNNGVAGDAPQM